MLPCAYSTRLDPEDPSDDLPRKLGQMSQKQSVTYIFE